MEINPTTQAIPNTADERTKKIKETEEDTKKEEQRTNLDKNDFLKLFVTSLQYQDPMSPMQPGEMMQQMAQLGFMEQVTNMSQSVEKMTKTFEETKLLQGASMIGKQVGAVGDDNKVIEGKVDKVGFDPNGIIQLLIGDKSVSIGQVVTIGEPKKSEVKPEEKPEDSKNEPVTETKA